MGARAMSWGVLAAALVLLAVRSSSVPLLDPDESRFARTSVEMLRSHDLVVPTFNAEPRLAKPPLLHWLQSLVFRTFGIDEWTARVHAVLATLVSAALVSWIARRRYGDEGAVWAGAVFITTPLVVVAGRLGTLDALLAAHVLAVVALDLAAPREGRSDQRALAIGALTGLAFLVKGPVGSVLPLVILLAGRTAAGRQVVPPARSQLLAAAAWAVVVLPWTLALVSRVGAERAIATLHSEVVDRVFAGTTHVEPAWYYGKVVLIGFLPWSLPLLAALFHTWRERESPGSTTARYAAGGLVAGLVLFSLSRGKVPTYLLPLAPLASILITWEIGREIEAPARRTLVPTLLAASVAGLALVAALSLFRLEGAAETTAAVGAVAFALGAVPGFWGALGRRPRWVYAGAAGAAWSFFVAASVVLLPDLGRSRSAATLVDQVHELRDARRVVTVEMQVPSLAFYLDRPTQLVPMAGLLARLDEPDRPAFVFADVDLPELPPAASARLEEVGRHAKFRVFVEHDRGAPPEIAR